MTPNRQKAEELIYRTMDALDKSGRNSSYYKEKFAKMSDAAFRTFLSKKYPIKFQSLPFDIEPNMDECNKAANILQVPLLEKVSLPYLYRDEKGRPVKTKECLVCYLHIKRPKQMLIKKNSMSTNISSRDMKNGRLIFADKNGMTTDREMESLFVRNLPATAAEFRGPRADAMEAKSKWYNTISTDGMVYQKDIKQDPDDYLSKNLVNNYLIGACIYTNMINEEYMTPYTMKNRKRKIERES